MAWTAILPSKEGRHLRVPRIMGKENSITKLAIRVLDKHTNWTAVVRIGSSRNRREFEPVVLTFHGNKGGLLQRALGAIRFYRD